MQWTTGINFAIQHTMANSRSKQQQLQQQQYSNTLLYTAAGRYIRIHTRTSRSSVQYNDYNRSGPGTLLWNRTRCLRNKKIKVLTTEQQQQRQQHYVCIYNWLLDCSDDTSTIIDDRTYFYTGTKTVCITKKSKKSRTWLEPQTQSQRDSSLYGHLLRFVHDDFFRLIRFYTYEWTFG